VVALTAALGFGCQLFRGETRHGSRQVCKSDHDCLYGLVCIEGDAATSPPKHCVYEQYSACTSTRQCYPGRTCREGYCEVQCVVDSDCRNAAPDGGRLEEASCVVGECQTPGGGAACSSVTDCAFDEACVEGRCTSKENEPRP
jgi:hypothetical protein